MRNQSYDLMGIGLGPFNLSLVALLAPLKKLQLKVLDENQSFHWHPELLFGDAEMQTSFLKDLVTPVDPTNPYSFLNYLIHKNQFYQFINTNRMNITRWEFQDYCQWVCESLKENFSFDSRVQSVSLDGDYFKVTSEGGEFYTRNLCIGSGPVKRIPECAKPHLGKKVFHAKSKELWDVDFNGKNVLVVGGGQTGLEILRNALQGQWGRARNIKLLTGRENLIPLDEGPFTNEFFTPEFVSGFHDLDQVKKDEITNHLLYTSDGNTPSYLQSFYNELYFDKFYSKKLPDYEILPLRWLEEIELKGGSYLTTVKNNFNHRVEFYEADYIILATGFESRTPPYLDGLKERIEFDGQNRLVVAKNYQVKTNLFPQNKIYVVNHSRHMHGVADPQTSLMAWRSSVIINDLIGEKVYKPQVDSFNLISFFKGENNVL